MPAKTDQPEIEWRRASLVRPSRPILPARAILSAKSRNRVRETERSACARVFRCCYTCARMLPGHATAAGTARFHDRFTSLRDAGHFRRAEQVPGARELWLSSIGLGTYLGEPDDAADQPTRKPSTTALASGVNVLDTAINYRHQRSERNIGEALRQSDQRRQVAAR